MQPRLLKHPARLAGASLLRLQDDQRLVALAREGHDPAFAAIVDRYGRQLERYCARLLGPARAEDAVQQAFVNAHAAMRATDDELALKPWLYRIAHNAALNILRASRDEDEVLDAERPGTVQTAEIVELRERLRETFASIQALPASQRDALLLRELEGRSHQEIAAALGISEGGARQHLHRARVSLRAAASAITPYPVLARVLSASADEGGRSADIVSGAGLGAGAGAIKVAAGVLAAGAIAGGAVGVHHRPAQARATADPTHTSTSRSTAATSEANRPSAGLLTIADHQSAGARSDRGHGHGAGGARGHGHRQHDRGGDRRPAGVFEDHRGSSDSGGSGGSETTAEHSGSHEGSSGSGSGSGGSDDTTTEASHDGSTTTTTTTSDGGSSGGSGSSDLSGTTTSSDGGESTTTTSTTTTGSSGSDGGLTSGSNDVKTTDG